MQLEQQAVLPHHVTCRLSFASCTRAHVEHPERNEDAMVVDRKKGLVALLDGVGGIAHGALASHTASRTIRAGWRRRLAAVQAGSVMVGEEASNEIPRTMCELLQEAHMAVRKRGEKQVDEEGHETTRYGATTVVLAIFCLHAAMDGYTVHYAHVGDSRIYLLAYNIGLQRLTEDDGYFTREVGKGELSVEDALRIEQASRAEALSEEERVHFEKRNGITQSLGEKEKINIHYGATQLRARDRLLLCSDGIHDNLTDDELAEMLRWGARTTIAKTLVRKATERSQQEHLRAKRDDMSCVVVTCW